MKKTIIFAFAVALLCVACKNKKEQQTVVPNVKYEHTTARGMYYWKTVFSLDSAENRFLREHKVGRMYVRFFDVAVETAYGYGDQVVPSATIIMKDSVPEGLEIVPTVFLTVEAMAKMQKDKTIQTTAVKMYERIKNMCSYNNISNWHEVQLDCDWTQNTQKPFYQFCKAMAKLCHKDNKLLSSTIRLHQLKQDVPPVDYGVLMVYNTSNLQNPEVKNSIISEEDAEPYLKNLKGFRLPLDIAYPAYNWNLSFYKGIFRGIVRSKHEADSLKKCGYTIRHEEAESMTTIAIKKQIDKILPKEKSTIIYHLDKSNLSKYSHEEIENIFAD